MYFLISFILIMYYLYLKIAYGGLAFSEVFLIIAFCLIIYRLIRDYIKKNSSLYNFIKFFIIIFISFFVFVEGLIILYPKNNISSESDYMIILGAAVKGNTPSLTLQGRLNTALYYIKNTDDDFYIVVSGGQGNDENLPEAIAMKNYLIKNGISEDKIIVEDKSTSTYENFSYSKEEIENHSSKNIEDLDIKVVTTDFHSLRSNLIAKRNGYENVTFYCSKSLPQFVPTYYTREFFALIKTFILDRNL